MNRNFRETHRSVLLTFKFAGVATLGSLVMGAVCVFAPIEGQLGMLGALVSILSGVLLSYTDQEAEREERLAKVLERVGIPFTLANDQELYKHYEEWSSALSRVAMQSDPILRSIAALRVGAMRDELEELADGSVVFSATEAWRTVYEQLLQSPDVPEYQSVAVVKSSDYWQDVPGRQSLAVNYDAVRRGVLIERIVVLPDRLWPLDTELPSPEIRPWIEEQFNHGIWLSLVRESRLAGERGLLEDIGIYGNRAVGRQQLDENSRNSRFVLSFDSDVIRRARVQWERLKIFSLPYRDLLDLFNRGQ